MKEKITDSLVIAAIFGSGWALEYASKSYAGVALTLVGLGFYSVIKIFEAKEQAEHARRIKEIEDTLESHKITLRNVQEILYQNRIS